MTQPQSQIVEEVRSTSKVELYMCVPNLMQIKKTIVFAHLNYDRHMKSSTFELGLSISLFKFILCPLLRISFVTMGELWQTGHSWRLTLSR